MNLLPSDDQIQIVDAVRVFLAAEAPTDRFRAHGELGNPDAVLLPALGDLGFLGLALPVHHGGSGLTAADEMLVVREFGRWLVTPAVLGVMAAGHVLSASGADGEALSDLVRGARRVGLANRRRLPPSETGEDEIHLIEADGASLILFWDEVSVTLWDRADFATIQTVPGMDATLDLGRTRLPQAKPLARVEDGGALAGRVTLLLAAYAVGLSEAARDMAVAYAKNREQFSRPIGAFQAIKHKCAEMAMRCESALCQTTFAALVAANKSPDAVFHATAAKMVATNAALKNAAQNIQVHGAFGFTSEGAAHHYLKRAHLFEALGGDIRVQRERLLAMPTPA